MSFFGGPREREGDGKKETWKATVRGRAREPVRQRGAPWRCGHVFPMAGHLTSGGTGGQEELEDRGAEASAWSSAVARRWSAAVRGSPPKRTRS